MKATWIMIANASTARCFAREPGGALSLLASFDHPDSRQPGAKLGADRPGHIEGEGHGLGSASYQPRIDPKQWEHDKFAQELARWLDDGVAAHRCDALVLLASAPFLGSVKAHLGTQALKLLTTAAPIDLTSFDGRDLKERVERVMAG